MGGNMKKIIVVGNGMVGFKFCEKLHQADQEKNFEIQVFGEEQWPAYDRVHLSSFFEGKAKDELLLAPREWYENRSIELLTNTLIVQINRNLQVVIDHLGNKHQYDYLVLATGSSAFVPAVTGVEKKGVFVYRTLEDLEALKSYASHCKSAAILGGGLLGLEAAKAALDLGLQTHVVEFAPRLMARQLDDQGALLLKTKMEELGIQIHLQKTTSEILGNGKLKGLQFTDGSFLEVDMLIISAGIKPRDELARKTGLAVAPRGGIVVDDHLKTSDPNIYVIGEAASHRGLIYGLVAPGYEMATQVVNQLIGKEVKPFEGFDMSTKLKLIEVEVGSFGDALGETPGSKPILYKNKTKGIYKRVNISADGKRLLGGILVGDTSQYGMLHQFFQNHMALPPEPEDLILGNRGGKSAQGFGIDALPDSAQVCACENITKLHLCQAVQEGNQNISSLKECTKAGTGCGGCLPMVNDLLNSELKKLGKAVKTTLCEHFSYTRQELLDLIKIKEIKTFRALINEFGSGQGCEICKPVVASLLASTWNEPIVKHQHIQDTNDRYLANIQKGGSYSVVPRIAGGEITPEKLIVIGQVAAKYQLYTKITGGQRIDLFGARVDQLPDIWEELIAAGFESGHAYGKSLRTVKSCVGSTWCRFGVQDSVSFAIEIENRYKGLRAPHKIKGAVSGCIRECAEAQSKDFGIIATEKGWNLYVCGNGGSKPQHALLFATDLDSKTCIQYIDRFLMYYIKTADPLTRTATWLNKLEGGIDHLREVVIDDSLGLGEELEREMEFLVNTYSCEWKEVVENPQLRARFKPFINTEEPDSSLQFEPLRGQKIPSNWV